MDLKKQFSHIKNWVIETLKAVVFEVKRAALLLAFGFVCTIADAQDIAKGGTAITTAGTDIARYITPVKNLMYAIAAVIAIVGAFSVYFKMQNGDQDVKKSIMMTVGGCIAMIAMATSLPAIFGH